MPDFILLARLYFEFFKTGLFSVGGGLATLPFLSEMSDKTGWFTREQLADMIAVSESTPGPIGINTATYVGFSTAGILGAVVATIGLVTPSIIIILLITSVLNKFKSNFLIITTFKYLRPASVGLILSSFISLAAMTFFRESGVSLSNINLSAIILAAIIFIFTNFVKQTKNFHPIIWIGISAVIGVFILT